MFQQIRQFASRHFSDLLNLAKFVPNLMICAFCAAAILVIHFIWLLHNGMMVLLVWYRVFPAFPVTSARLNDSGSSDLQEANRERGQASQPISLDNLPTQRPTDERSRDIEVRYVTWRSYVINMLSLMSGTGSLYTTVLTSFIPKAKAGSNSIVRDIYLASFLLTGLNNLILIGLCLCMYSTSGQDWSQRSVFVRVILGETLIRSLVLVILLPSIALTVESWKLPEPLVDRILHSVSTVAVTLFANAVLWTAGKFRGVPLSNYIESGPIQWLKQKMVPEFSASLRPG